jgi:hypothetical protein
LTLEMIGSFGSVDLPVFGPGGAKRDIRFMSGEKECSEALSIPKARKGRGSEHGGFFAPRGAAQAGWTEGAERSLEFAWKRMSNAKTSRKLLRIVFQKGGVARQDLRSILPGTKKLEMHEVQPPAAARAGIIAAKNAPAGQRQIRTNI